MLKKDPPPWGKSYTIVVKALKEKFKDFFPLQIPSYGKRILQIDASDKYWAVILLEEVECMRYGGI